MKMLKMSFQKWKADRIGGDIWQRFRRQAAAVVSVGVWVRTIAVACTSTMYAQLLLAIRFFRNEPQREKHFRAHAKGYYRYDKRLFLLIHFHLKLRRQVGRKWSRRWRTTHIFSSLATAAFPDDFAARGDKMGVKWSFSIIFSFRSITGGNAETNAKKRKACKYLVLYHQLFRRPRCCCCWFRRGNDPGPG